MPATVTESSEGIGSAGDALGGRPAGVVVAAAIYVVGSVYGLIGLAAASAASFAGGFFWNLFGAYPFPAGAGFLGAQLLGIVIAFGLWQSHTWAWYSVVLLSVVSAWGSLAALQFGGVGWSIVGLVFAGTLLWYFLSPHVQAAFGTDYRTPWSYPKLP